MQIIEEILQFFLIAKLQELAQLGDIINKEVMVMKTNIKVKVKDTLCIMIFEDVVFIRYYF